MNELGRDGWGESEEFEEKKETVTDLDDDDELLASTEIHKDEDIERLLADTNELYSENLENINEENQTIINDILGDVELYNDQKPERWIGVLKKLDSIIRDYKSSDFDQADRDLEQLSLSVRRLKKDITT